MAEDFKAQWSDIFQRRDESRNSERVEFLAVRNKQLELREWFAWWLGLSWLRLLVLSALNYGLGRAGHPAN